jgi:hypothetical protein
MNDAHVCVNIGKDVDHEPNPYLDSYVMESRIPHRNFTVQYSEYTYIEKQVAT